MHMKPKCLLWTYWANTHHPLWGGSCEPHVNCQPICIVSKQFAGESFELLLDWVKANRDLVKGGWQSTQMQGSCAIQCHLQGCQIIIISHHIISYHIILGTSQAADISISPYCKRTSWQLDWWGGVSSRFRDAVTTVIFAIPTKQLHSWWTKSCTSSRNWDLAGSQDLLSCMSGRHKARHLKPSSLLDFSLCMTKSIVRAERQLWTSQIQKVKAATQWPLHVTSWNWKNYLQNRKRMKTDIYAKKEYPINIYKSSHLHIHSSSSFVEVPKAAARCKATEASTKASPFIGRKKHDDETTCFPRKKWGTQQLPKRNTPPKINESNLKMVNWKMLFLFRGCILRFHVDLPGCIPATYTVKTHDFQGFTTLVGQNCKIVQEIFSAFVGRLTRFIQLG